MQSIKLKDKRTGAVTDYKGPGAWDELSRTQFMTAITTKVQLSDSFHQAILLVQLFFGIPLRLIKRLTTVQALQAAGMMNFLSEDKIMISSWHIPKIFKTEKKTLYGPSDGLGNICFGELMFADLCLRNYKKTENDAELIKLIAVLFREEDLENLERNGDIRAPFNKNQIANRAKVLSGLNEVTKQAVLINYIGCRELMSKSFRFVFPEGEKSKKESNETWLDVCIQMARKEHALGTIADIENSNAYLVLKVLDKVIKEGLELQAEYDKLKN